MNILSIHVNAVFQLFWHFEHNLWHDYQKEKMVRMTNPEGSATVEILIETRLTPITWIFDDLLTFYFYNFPDSDVFIPPS